MVALQHHLHQLVLEFPGRVLGHAQATAQFEARHAFLALSQVVHRREPRRQGQFGRVKDRASDQ
jgi:hypothetical protein